MRRSSWAAKTLCILSICVVVVGCAEPESEVADADSLNEAADVSPASGQCGSCSSCADCCDSDAKACELGMAKESSGCCSTAASEGNAACASACESVDGEGSCCKKDAAGSEACSQEDSPACCKITEPAGEAT